jgi:hypothetical protein
MRSFSSTLRFEGDGLISREAGAIVGVGGD